MITNFFNALYHVCSQITYKSGKPIGYADYGQVADINTQTANGLEVATGEQNPRTYPYVFMERPTTATYNNGLATYDIGLYFLDLVTSDNYNERRTRTDLVIADELAVLVRAVLGGLYQYQANLSLSGTSYIPFEIDTNQNLGFTTLYDFAAPDTHAILITLRVRCSLDCPIFQFDPNATPPLNIVYPPTPTDPDVKNFAGWNGDTNLPIQ